MLSDFAGSIFVADTHAYNQPVLCAAASLQCAQKATATRAETPLLVSLTRSVHPCVTTIRLIHPSQFQHAATVAAVVSQSNCLSGK